jgi:crotonobetainyl-CoA:carnitine CoA-transferase CaiB-like acyl-CoA transferase
MTTPLEGIRVVEVANWLAAPSCAALLADLGAEVVKVEPPGGDAYRHLLLMAAGYSYDFKANYAFQVDNRGKRSITLDLENPQGAQAVRRLCGQADIFVTNLTAERARRYGLAWDDLHALNPSLIYTGVSGYGSEGPDADRPGFDHTAFWARSGIMGLMGEEGVNPSTCRGGQGDHTTGLNALAATLAALRLRDKTGDGQHVEVTLQGSGLWTIALDVQAALVSGQEPFKRRRTHPVNPLSNTYQTRDGRWVLLMMPTPDAGYWQRFCRMISRPEWAGDERYLSLLTRRDHAVELTAGIDEAFAREDFAHWSVQLDTHRMVWAPVASLGEVIADPQPRVMNAFTPLEHGELGRFETLNTPFVIHGADIGVRGPAPDPGADTHAVLVDSGFDVEEITRLAESGALG